MTISLISLNYWNKEVENMRQIKENEKVKLEDNLFFAGTIYDSFEALEEAMGKLQLERPLFLVYFLIARTSSEERY